MARPGGAGNATAAANSPLRLTVRGLLSSGFCLSGEVVVLLGYSQQTFPPASL
jgi:hypothetical protein